MEDLKITWKGHACFEFTCGDHTAVIDPYREVPGYPPLALEAGEVYASHTQHDDHGYFEAVKLVAQPGKSPFKVTTVDTFHDPEGGALRGRNKITLIEAGGVRLAHFGDLGHELSDEQLEAVKGSDIIMIPVGGFYTIDGVQAARLAEATGAKLIVPMHFRSGDKGFDVIDTPDAFMNALNADITRYDADDNVIKVADRHAYVSAGGDTVGIKLDGAGRAAVLLHFN